MPLTNTQRERIVAEGKTWWNTPYRGWTCLKGVGADCGQLLKGVFVGAGFKKVADVKIPLTYSLRAGTHNKSTEYLGLVEQCMREIPESEVKPGDVVVYRVGLSFAHAAIIVTWPEVVIHTLDGLGCHASHGGATQFSQNHMLKDLDKKFYTLRDEFIEEEK